MPENMTDCHPTNESVDEIVKGNSSEKKVINEERRKRKYVEDESVIYNNAAKENVKEEVIKVKENESLEDIEDKKENDGESTKDGTCCVAFMEEKVPEVGDKKSLEEKDMKECKEGAVDEAEEEDDDESASETADSSDENFSDYDESELPNIDFPKFIIPRVPASSFPTDVLKHMKKDAQPRNAVKLMQICKYFCHEEFPFLPMKYIRYYTDYGFSYKTLEGQEVDYTDNRILKLFEKKLWMTNEIYLEYSIPINYFFRYIVACDLKELRLESQKLTIEQFKFLTFGGKIKKLILWAVSLNDENGAPIPVEEILKFVPIVEEFAFERSTIYHENVSNFIQSFNLAKLNFFALAALTEHFDFETFIDFITKHPKIQFSLRFKRGRISDEYFQKLQTFVEDLRKAGSYSRYVFSRIFCRNQTWRYGGADLWCELPRVSCKCTGHTLYSNFDPPYFRCTCDLYLTLKSTEAWNKKFHGYYE